MLSFSLKSLDDTMQDNTSFEYALFLFEFIHHFFRLQGLFGLYQNVNVFFIKIVTFEGDGFVQVGGVAIDWCPVPVR